MSVGQVSAARKELAAARLITIERPDDVSQSGGTDQADRVRIADLWPQNFATYAPAGRSPHEQGRSPHEQGRSPHEQGRSPHELKKELSEERTNEEEGKGASPARPPAKTQSKGTRIPSGFTPHPDDVAAISQECQELDIDRATREFCDYWAGVSGSRAIKADWRATWRNAARRTYEMGHCLKVAPTRSATRPARDRQAEALAAIDEVGPRPGRGRKRRILGSGKDRTDGGGGNLSPRIAPGGPRSAGRERAARFPYSDPWQLCGSRSKALRPGSGPASRTRFTVLRPTDDEVPGPERSGNGGGDYLRPSRPAGLRSPGRDPDARADKGSLRPLSRLHDGLDLLQIVDVERGNRVVVNRSVVQKLTHRNECHDEIPRKLKTCRGLPHFW